MKIETYGSKSAWLAAREGRVGASEVAAILGLHPWVGALEVYARHLHLMPDPEETLAMQLGEPMEPIVAGLYERETGRQTSRPVPEGEYALCVSDKVSGLVCTPDRWIHSASEQAQGVLQIKTTGPHLEKVWEEEPPVTVQAQVQTELLVTGEVGVTYGSVAVLIWRPKFLWCDVEPHPAFQALIAEKVPEFLRRVELRDPPRPDQAQDSAKAALAAIYPEEEPGKVIALPAEAGAWHEQKVEGKRQKDEGQRLENEANGMLRSYLGDAERGVFADGSGYTLKIVHKKSYTVAEQSYRELRQMKGR